MGILRLCLLGVAALIAANLMVAQAAPRRFAERQGKLLSAAVPLPPGGGVLHGAVQQPALSAQVSPSAIVLGGDVTVVAHGQPRSRMSISAEELGFTQFMSLLPTQADQFGRASWRFNVGSGYRSDSLPIVITQDSAGVQQKLVLNVPVLRRDTQRARLPLEFISIPRSARAGQRVSVTVRTIPGAKVRIEAQGAGFPQASSLMDRTANKQGLITWTWQLRTNYEANVMPVIATAQLKEDETKAVGQIIVVPGAVEPSAPQQK